MDKDAWYVDHSALTNNKQHHLMANASTSPIRLFATTHTTTQQQPSSSSNNNDNTQQNTSRKTTTLLCDATMTLRELHHAVISAQKLTHRQLPPHPNARLRIGQRTLRIDDTTLHAAGAHDLDSIVLIGTAPSQGFGPLHQLFEQLVDTLQPAPSAAADGGVGMAGDGGLNPR